MARRDNDPYSNFRFRVEINNVQVAGFSECTGLNAETKVVDFKEGGNNHTTLKFPEHTTYGNITLKRGSTRSTDLFDWQQDLANGAFEKYPRRGNPQLSIILVDDKGKDVKRWNLVRPLPVKWVSGDLKASASEVLIETLELAHEGILK